MRKAFSLLLLPTLLLLCFRSHSATLDAKQETLIQHFSSIALRCVHQQYPNKIAHTMNSDADAKTPKQLYPIFYGCYDWHSSVHGHWLLVRTLNSMPDISTKAAIVNALNQSFTAANVAVEVEYFARPGRSSFERPYGLAWFLQLTAELRESQLAEARRWLSTLKPLEQTIVKQIKSWLPKLAYPIRTGEHSQTAFAFGLFWDWALAASEVDMQALLRERIKALYFKDTNCPLAYEPSGQDFLSPCIAQADLMRRALSPADYAQWLQRFLPMLPTSTTADWLPIGRVTDNTDGKLVHLHGFNLSRAWMLEGIASTIDKDDPRLGAINQAAAAHKKAGVDAVLADMHYMGSHWLGSFAMYLVTQRGL